MVTKSPELRTVQWQLPDGLLEALEHQAAIEELAPELLAARVLEAGLIELGIMPNGRCSVRTGLCGSGPVPLPIQQQPSGARPPA
jgi:hypothetical protein